MPDDTPKPSLRNPLSILAMALDRQADELSNPEWKAAKKAAAAKARELAAKQPPPGAAPTRDETE